MKNSVVIIAPVYAGEADVKACLSSVLSSVGSIPYEVLVIYDAGPEPEVERYLDQLERDKKITLYKNTSNLGFVKTVNKGFSLCEGRDCVLLNTDTIVPSGWLDRLISLAKTDKKIATITPFTNNGEICSFPVFCADNNLLDDFSIAEIDDCFRMDVTPIAIDVPTGVGFCMYVSAKALSLEKGFDEKSFGRGYGEENDFCVRLAKRGYRNVLCSNLFVYHSGGVSFGAEKKALMSNASAIIDKLHPDYHESVFQHVSLNPAKPYRFQALLSLIGKSKKPTVLMILHGFGGGTEKYVADLVAHHSQRINFLCLKPSGVDSVRLDFPAWAGDYSYEFQLKDHGRLLKTILNAVDINFIHINHIKGIEGLTFELIEELSAPYIVTLHDYFFISENPTLTDEAGFFDIDYVETNFLSDTGLTEDLSRRKAGMSSVLNGAIKVLAPSSQLFGIYSRWFPGIRLQLSEHIDSELAGKYPPVKVRSRSVGSVVKIVVIGALGKEKGADILEQVAISALNHGFKLEFHLLGYAYRDLHRSVITHGQYQEQELQGLIEGLAPAFIWFPGLCAESYSYTLSVILEMGLPAMVPEIGALHSRTSGRPATRSVSHESSIEEFLKQLLIFSEDLLQIEGQLLEWCDQADKTRFYIDQYYDLASSNQRTSKPVIPSIDCIESLSKPKAVSALTRRERILRILVKIRSNPAVYKILSVIPFSVQRKIKRFFSSKSIHEL